MKRKIFIFIIAIILLFFNIALSHSLDLTKKSSDVSMLNSYIRHVNCFLDSNTTIKIAKSIIHQSNKYNVPWEIIACVAEAESTFYPNELGKLSEIGIMQILTLECNGEIFDKNRLFDIDYNIECGIKIFKYKVNKSGDILKGIMYYNGKGDKAEQYLFKICLKLIYMLDYRIRYFNYGEANKK